MSRSHRPRTPAVALVAMLLLGGLPSTAVAAPPAEEVRSRPDLAQVDAVIVTYDDRRAARGIVGEVADGAVTSLAPDVVAVEVDDVGAAIDALRHVPGVRAVEPDWPLALSSTSLPSDPHFGVQWGLRNTGQSGGVPGADIAALAAWDVLDVSGVDEIVVAVTDSGIDGAHPDLSSRMWRNDGSHSACPAGSTGYDFIQDICAVGGIDPIGHGTHVAGTVAAAIDNGVGVAGVAPNVRLLDLRFMDATGTGSTSHAIAAVNLATTLAQSGVPLRVLNASWGGPNSSIALRDALTAAGAAGILIVAAAGNEGEDVDATPTYPCAYPSATIVCVAASSRSDTQPSWSNYGRSSVDLAAPGVAIASTWPGGEYTYMAGTSTAAPHVAGVAAMLAGTCATTVADVRDGLLGGVDLRSAFSTTTATGGRLDAAGALAAAGCTGALSQPGAPGPALIGPSTPVVSWTAGGGEVFTLQRATPGGSTWTDVASGLTETRFDLSATSEGRMDLRVIGARGEETATSPVTAGAVIDRTAPTVSVTGCPTADLTIGASVEVQVTASDTGSGLSEDPSGARTLETVAVGTLTTTFTATDRVALSASAGCTYTVIHELLGDDAGEDDSGAADTLEVPQQIESATAAATALEVSRMRFGDVTTDAAEMRPSAAHAVLARDDEFADALAGAPLVADGPLLLTPAAGLAEDAADELQRILPLGGTVYLLGGENALHGTVETEIRELGLVPRRLSGPSRIETALRIADEVLATGDAGPDVLLARAYGPAENPTAAWADAISGGAYGAAHTTPVVLTPTDTLHPSVAAWITATDRTALLLGGTAALSEAVGAALPGSTRIFGPDRAATAAAVATQLWGLPAPLDTALLIDGWAGEGWAYGLAAAGLAADLGAPLLVVGDTLPPATAALLACATTTITIGPASGTAYLDQGCAS